MTIDEIRKLLAADNKGGRLADVEMYAQQFVTYFEACENISAHGAIVLHPRNGQPIENPYLKLRAGAEAAMRNLGRVKSDKLWAAAVARLSPRK